MKEWWELPERRNYAQVGGYTTGREAQAAKKLTKAYNDQRRQWGIDIGKEWERRVGAAASNGGWRFMHQLAGQAKVGQWLTMTNGHVGFPDYVLIHAERGWIVFAELKSGQAHESKEQAKWREAILRVLGRMGAEGADHIRATLWHCSQWREVEAFLDGRTESCP